MTMVHEGLEAWAPLMSSRADSTVATERAKRVLDAAVAAVLLLVFLPLLMAVALAVVVSSPGPVLFRQRRVGREGIEFDVLKFRTMVRDAEGRLRATPGLHGRYLAGGYKLPPGSDPRVTTVGGWLRRLDLDELPQLWNVLRGQMSLVGPRPVPAAELADRYGRLRHHYESVRPGMTGLWQVSGRNRLAYSERVALDVAYAQRLSVRRDLVILARTLPALARGGGAPPDEQPVRHTYPAAHKHIAVTPSPGF